MNRYRVTVECWTLVDVDVLGEDEVDARDRAMADMPFPPPEGWNSLDFDFKVAEVQDDGPTDPGTPAYKQDLLEWRGHEPWGTYDPDRATWDVRPEDVEEDLGA